MEEKIIIEKISNLLNKKGLKINKSSQIKLPWSFDIFGENNLVLRYLL